jgi:hypothetical protein
LRTPDSQVIKQVKPVAIKAAATAVEATDDMFRRVIAIARGMRAASVAPGAHHDRKGKLTAIVQIGAPVLTFFGGMAFGRKRRH